MPEEPNAAWREYEARGLSLLAKKRLCGACPQRAWCDWPDQYTKPQLDGIAIVYATHTHLHLDPHFVPRLVELTGARRPLVLIDEVVWLFQNYRYTIAPRDLRQHLEVLQGIDGSHEALAQKWAAHCVPLTGGSTRDLQAGPWRPPPLPPPFAAEVQERGDRRFGGDFRFIGRLVELFGRSPPSSRERMDDGRICFTAVPVFDCPLMVFSATVSADLLSWRFDQRFENLYPDLDVRHPGTRWFNLRSARGAARSFFGNEKLILDLFALLISKRIGDRLEAVAGLTQRVLIEAVQERFPELRPRAEVNIDRPECWNDEGRAGSLRELVDEPDGRNVELVTA